MAKVICTRPNASNEINGVKFVAHPDVPGAMVSEDISDEQAANFARVPGYDIVGAAPKEPVSAGGEVLSAPPARAEQLKVRTVKELGVMANGMKITVLEGWKKADFIDAIIAAETAANKPAGTEGGDQGGAGAGTGGDAGSDGQSTQTSDGGAGEAGAAAGGTAPADAGKSDPEIF